MSKLVFLLMSFALLSFVAGNVLGADINWTNTSGDGLWVTPGNWSTGVPHIATLDKAKIIRLAPNDAHINAGDAAECTWLVVGDNASGEMHITGGTLNVNKGTGLDSWTIVAYGPSDIGILTIDDGIITTDNRLFVGYQGNGALNMNAGTLNIGGTFGVGFGETSYTTGRGTVNLAGGTINVAGEFWMSSPVGAVGHLDITGGTLTIAGDKVTKVNGYVTSKYITAYGGLGTVMTRYDANAPAKTIVTGVTDSTRARLPYPADNAANVPPYITLNWVQSSAAVTQDIYFGTNSNSVLNATTSTSGIYKTSVTHDANTYAPAGLALNATYYWRVDEVNGVGGISKGNLWQFKVAAYSLVDDFETYADTAGMLASWSNGGTGATLSLATANGHDNAKSMKFDYDNSNTPLYSEAQTAGINADWTIAGVMAMDIWYKGGAGNAAQPMYAALKDKNSSTVAVVVNSDPNAAKAADWQVWHIALSDFAGVNLANVEKLYIGFGSRTAPAVGGAGTVYFDDIRLYPSRCLTQPSTDLNNDCVVDFKDFAIFAGNWMGQ